MFYNLEIWGLLPQVVLLIFLGTVGLAAVGTLYAALTANIRAREALLPVLLLVGLAYIWKKGGLEWQ